MRTGKRVFDLLVISVLFVPLVPLLIFLALLVRWQIGSPILFQQVRPGLFGKPFTIYKFRTMTDARDAEGNWLPDEDRCPPFGRFLRSSSLDELPEIWNVLRGEMSLVGPRPLVMEYLARYNAEQARRNDVVPGITGWAQINGRNAISWPEKFKLDVWYVDHWSLWLDMKILAFTAVKVFKREGISAPGELTATEFMGNED
jgi:sugar transferase EpsL